MREFRRELDAAGLTCAVPGGFDVVGEACLAGCDHPCTVACLAADKTSYLFGGFETSGDIAAMVAFARQYSQSETGWTRSQDRPAGLKGKILARLPVFGTSLNLADEGAS